MSSVEAEAAASLFGATDSSGDPFSAVLGGEGNPVDAPATETTPASTADPASLFDTATSSSGADTYSYDNWLSQADNQHEAYPPVTQEAGASYTSGTQGWYGQSDQWTGYDQPQTNYGHTGANGSYDQTAYAAPSAPELYAPNSYTPAPSSYDPHPNGSQPAPHYAPSVYDPYAPQTALSQYPPNNYTPASSQPYSQPSTSYDPYIPSTSTAPHTNAQLPPARAVPPVVAPPPPVPKAEVYRPKVSNAYDPPLPPVKPKHRGASSKSPPVAAFSPPGSHALPPLPPSPYVQNRHITSPPPLPPPRVPSAGIRSVHSASSSDYSRAYSPSATSGPRTSHSQQGSSGGYTPSEGHSRTLSPPYGSVAGSYYPMGHSPGFSESAPMFSSEPQMQSLSTAVEDLTLSANLSAQLPPSHASPYGSEVIHDNPQSTIAASEETTGTAWSDHPDPEDLYEQPAVEPPTAVPSVLSSTTVEHGLDRVTSPDRMSVRSAKSVGSDRSQGNQSSIGAPPWSSGSYSYEPHPSSNRSSLDRYAPAKSPTTSPPPLAVNGYSIPSPAVDPYKPDPYAPSTSQPTQRAKSPSSASVRSWTSSHEAQGPYSHSSRSQSPVVQSSPRDRATSNGVQFAPPRPPAATSPYAPAYGLKRESSEASDYGDAWTSRSYPGMQAAPAPSAPEPDHGQDVYLSAPARAPYAPSPTLLGANDPLGRISARAPLVSFGFGGKLLTCFHGSSSLSTGFDVALSSKPLTDIQMRLLHKVLPESASDVLVPSYPGPLYSDPGTPTTTSLVRTSASQVKAKKARVIKYLEEKEEEITRAVGYLTRGTPEHRQAEGKLVLVKLLKIMVENDGKLSGSESVDSAARSALVPRIHSTTSGEAGVPTTDLSLGYPGLASSQSIANEVPLATYAVTASALDKIQDFLLRGERRKACHYALDEKLWAHAMLIASSVDKEAWKEVVHEFLRTELGYRADRAHGPSAVNGKDADPGRTSLRIAYRLFAGEGAASVQEMVPPKLLSKTTDTLQIPQPVAHMAAATPVSPNFPSPALTAKVPEQVLADWPETAAMLLSNPMTADASSALTSLGDYLSANQWVEAAHACYLLSPQTSIIGGVAGPSVRVVLMASPSPQVVTSFNRDHDPIILSEILEFALSLAPAVKGQEPFVGLPHLQAYRLIRASALAELGHVQLANRYCEAIRSSMARQSPYLNVTFVHCLRELSDRLVAAPQIDKAGSWIGGKMSKPSLDSIGSWVGGRLTKFIAGDEERSPIEDPSRRSSQEDSPFAGPFTHYSAISSAVPSHTPSPAPSTHSLGFASTSPPPRRSGSAMALRPNPNNEAIVDRASSAMDYTRAKRSSPVPRMGSVDAASFGVPSFGQAVNGYGAGNGYGGYSHSRSSTDGATDSSWWNGGETDAVTPTASSFHTVNDTEGESEASNFVSLMDDTLTPMMSPMPSSSNVQSYEDEEDVEDLGFGNSTMKSKKAPENNVQTNAKEPEKKSQTGEVTHDISAPEKPPLNSASSGSWLSRWWKRENAPAPVKANLGEETSFYYDETQKRWVNKKAGTETAQPKPPPPPPSRAQTASPGRSGPGITPPPARPASAAAVDLTTPPKKPPIRVRSNLVPQGPDSAPTTPAAHAGLDPPPPPGRPRSQMAKRSVRSRYVDVFQPDAGS